MRCNFRNQASTAIQCKVSILSYTVTQSWERVAKKTPLATLVVLLGLGGGFWVTTEAIAPQVVQANTERIEISLDRQPNEPYQTLVSRAEAAALNSVQHSFDQDRLMTNVSVMIMGQNHGAIAPVLSLEVERNQWFSNPDLQPWVTYFRSARSLLGFEDVATTTPDQPGTVTPDTVEQSETATPNTEGTNNTPVEPESNTSVSTPGQPTNTTITQPGTATPVTPSQTPAANTDLLNRQSPATTPIVPANNLQSPSSSGLTPTTAPPTPSLNLPSSGTTINNPIPNNNPVATPTTPSGTVPVTTPLIE